MAAIVVLAEVKFRDGQREKISVKVENNLSSLINGMNELNWNVSRLLSDLVEREKTCKACTGEEEEVSDEEDEEPDNPQISKLQPPAKRYKTQNT